MDNTREFKKWLVEKEKQQKHWEYIRNTMAENEGLKGLLEAAHKRLKNDPEYLQSYLFINIESALEGEW